MVIRNLIWDLDGTLFDTYPAMVAAMQEALAGLGVDAPADQLEALMRVSVSHCTEAFAVAHQLRDEDIVRAFLQCYERARPEDQPPFPGVREVCAAVTTAGGKNAIVTHRRRATTGMLLADHNMQDLFVGAITADDGLPRKPDPAAFQTALRLFGLPAEQTLAVGDRDIDILGGQAAGLCTALFGQPIDDLAPDLIVAGFDELLQYLVTQPRWPRSDAGRR